MLAILFNIFLKKWLSIIMARSLWKGPSVNFRSLFKRNKIYTRSSFILPQFVGKTFGIHNGKFFLQVKISEQMIGHKFGEFASTRRKTKHKIK
tara:strand:- start:205 stop:483 length:279 start_codon:yes stop_codon:yes gene_type:complete